MLICRKNVINYTYEIDHGYGNENGDRDDRVATGTGRCTDDLALIHYNECRYTRILNSLN